MDVTFFIKVVIVICAGLVGVGSVLVGKYKGQQDNPTEEIAEDIIKKETGVDIDLTPSSKEKGA